MPKPAAYWVSTSERCTHCLQPYSYVAVRHCHVCDGPACPHCVTVIEQSQEIVCVRCAETPEEQEP